MLIEPASGVPPGGAFTARVEGARPGTQVRWDVQRNARFERIDSLRQQAVFRLLGAGEAEVSAEVEGRRLLGTVNAGPRGGSPAGNGARAPATRPAMDTRLPDGDLSDPARSATGAVGRGTTTHAPGPVGAVTSPMVTGPAVTQTAQVETTAAVAAGNRPASTPDPRADALRAVSEALQQYAVENGGKPPDRLSLLFFQGYANDISLFAGASPPAPIANPAEIDAKAAFDLVPPPKNPARLHPALREKRAGGGTIYQALSDGTIEKVRESDVAKIDELLRTAWGCEENNSPDEARKAYREALALLPGCGCAASGLDALGGRDPSSARPPR